MKYAFALAGIFASARGLEPQQRLGSLAKLDPYSAGGPFTTGFDERVQTLLDHFHVPAVSISVVDGDKTFAKGYGFAILDEERATTETLYYTGSTTKSFTAASVLKLIEDSANGSKPLTLKTKIQSLTRDEFVLPDAYATSHVNLEDALSHRTGMPRHDLSYGAPNATLADAVGNLRHLPMTAELREKWQYCNMMFMVVSHVIERITGRWLGDVFRERIWGPLGMHSTFLSLADAREAAGKGGPQLAVGYAWDDDRKVYRRKEYTDVPIISGAGNTISNVIDYAKYMRAMLAMDDTILSEKSYRELRTPRALAAAEYNHSRIVTGPSTYSLAWDISVYRGYEIFAHSGSIGGFGAQMAYIPELGDSVGLSLMTNTASQGNMVAQILMVALIDDMLGVSEADRVDLVSEFDELLEKRRAEQDPEKARRSKYPTAPGPKDSLPTPVPLGNFVGEYWNDGYQNITLALVEASSTPLAQRVTGKVLHLEALNRALPHTITFEHVTGSYFLGWGYEVNGGESTLVNAVRVEFEVGVDGKAERVGIEYEAAMEELIWFDRRASSPAIW
jgi:CubicO group peptidase (beta-lactamase class C family)